MGKNKKKPADNELYNGFVSKKVDWGDKIDIPGHWLGIMIHDVLTHPNVALDNHYDLSGRAIWSALIYQALSTSVAPKQLKAIKQVLDNGQIVLIAARSVRHIYNRHFPDQRIGAIKDFHRAKVFYMFIGLLFEKHETEKLQRFVNGFVWDNIELIKKLALVQVESQATTPGNVNGEKAKVHEVQGSKRKRNISPESGPMDVGEAELASNISSLLAFPSIDNAEAATKPAAKGNVDQGLVPVKSTLLGGSSPSGGRDCPTIMAAGLHLCPELAAQKLKELSLEDQRSFVES